MAFRLVKWYLDVVGADGDCAIVYAADIGLGGMHLVANAILESPALDASAGPSEARTTERTALIGARMPEPTADGWTWACERLGSHGRWRRPHAAGPEQVLYAEGTKAVRWECIAPTAHATLVTPGRMIEGPGYLERLELTLEPWRLPLSTLRWGRFTTFARSVVWIQWRGRHPLDLVLVDGIAHRSHLIDDTAVVWEGGRIELTPTRTLRDAPLGSGALSWLPTLADLLPIRFLRAHETKWLGRVRLEDASSDAAPVEGVAIWERVDFPPELSS